MIYSIDSSALILGFDDYTPKVFSTLWRRLDYLSQRGDLIASEEVLRELSKKDDGEPYEWLKSRPHMVIPIDDEIQVHMRTLMDKYPRLVNDQKNRSACDPWVIALAMVHDGAVVSAEKHRTRNLDRPKIPDVCDAEGITHLRLTEVFIRQGWDI